MNTINTVLKSVTFPAIATALLLMIPLVAMQFSYEVVWTLSDFIFAGVLIFGTGFTYKLITGRSESTAFRIAFGFALLTGFFLIWSNLAVGLIGSEDNEFNLLYFLVIGIGVSGAFIARFKAIGLMYTLFTMSAAQAVIAIAALLTGMSNVPHSSVYEILAVNGFFIMLFVVAAMLFRYADEENSSVDNY